MAYELSSAGGQYMEVVYSKTSLIPTAYPVTLACWFYIASGVGTTPHALVGLNDGSGNGQSLQVNAAGNLLASSRVGSTSSSAAISSSTVTQGTWQHAAGVFTGGSSRTVYLDGASNSSTNTRTWVTVDRVSIGRRIVSEATLDGRIAEAAIWTVALTASEINSLAKGLSPLSVRPSALLHYSPLVRSAHELCENETVTAYGADGGPSPSPHPRIYKK